MRLPSETDLGLSHAVVAGDGAETTPIQKAFGNATPPSAPVVPLPPPAGKRPAGGRRLAVSSQYRVHVNFVWRSYADITYPRYDCATPTTTVAVATAQPFDATSATTPPRVVQVLAFKRVGEGPELESVDSRAFIRTKASISLPCDPPIRCRQFDFRGCCMAAEECCFVHVAQLDPTQPYPRRRIRQRRQGVLPRPTTVAAPAAAEGHVSPLCVADIDHDDNDSSGASHNSAVPPMLATIATAALLEHDDAERAGAGHWWFNDPYHQRRVRVQRVPSPH